MTHRKKSDSEVAKLRERKRMLRSLLAGGAVVALSSTAALAQDDAPNSSLYSSRPRVAMAQGPAAPTAPEEMRQRYDGQPPLPLTRAPFASAYDRPPPTGWYEVPLPPPKEVRVKDIITIRVDVAQRTIAEGEVQRRKTGRWDALLNDWIVLNGFKSIKPAPQTDGDQRIQYNTNQQYRATGDLETAESVKFEIGTTVQSILPNGNLVLEAHSKVRINEELWLISLSCVCPREAIQPGNYVLSKNVADLNLEKKEIGIIRDGYRRGFITRFLDTFSPF